MRKIPIDGLQRAPNDTGAAFARYFHEGILPGGFLQSILANDLYSACSRADTANIRLFREYYYWLLEFAPEIAYGSREKNDCMVPAFCGR